jgi:hypothetical protein
MSRGPHHRKNVSGFRSISGKPHFFAYVDWERSEVKEVKVADTQPPAKTKVFLPEVPTDAEKSACCKL